LKSPAGTRFLFETALKSDFLFWAATRVARPVVTRAILATPPEVVKKADAAEQARVGEMLRHILPVSTRGSGLLNDAAVTSSLTRYELERIAAPTLVISMKDDLFGTFDGARYTADHVPGARFTGYPTGGHLWVGHQEEILAELRTGRLREETGTVRKMSRRNRADSGLPKRPVLAAAFGRILSRAVRRDVDENIRNEWQFKPDPAVEVVHRPAELLGIQARGWTDLGDDDHVFGPRVHRPEQQDFLDRGVLLDDRVQSLELRLGN
jgi:hypothetical protein